MPEIREYTPARLHSLTPYLATHDPAAAIEWYTEVFDARLLGDPIVMPDGRIGHAELRIGDTVFMLAGEFPEEDHRSPLTLGGSTVGLLLHVPDSDATYALAVERGATPLRPVAESYGARGGTIRDPFGHRWFVADRTRSRRRPGGGRARPALRRHRLHHAARCPTPRTAGAFYGALFGWTMHADRSGLPHRVDHTAGGHLGRHDHADAMHLLPRRRHRVGAAARARARRRGAVDRELRVRRQRRVRRRPGPALRPLPPPPRILTPHELASLRGPMRPEVTPVRLFQVEVEHADGVRRGRSCSTCSCVRSFMISSATFLVCGHVESLCG